MTMCWATSDSRSELFSGMRGMGRIWQGAATVDSILRGDLIVEAARAGLRSLFVGFETLSEANLAAANKRQNLRHDYGQAIRRLHDLGVMINGSFVFGLDEDDAGVFDRTVDWAVDQGLTTATFHILTPYPGTALHGRLSAQQRILHQDWARYDTRQAVYTPKRLTASELERGYWHAYQRFYEYRSIIRAAPSRTTAGSTAPSIWRTRWVGRSASRCGLPSSTPGACRGCCRCSSRC